MSAQLQQVHQQNELAKTDYERERTQVMVKLAIMVVQGIIIVFLLWLTFIRFPQREFLWTANAQAVCKAVKLDHASVHHATLTQFAMEAAIGLNSFDFLNYRRSLTLTTEQYLTPHGRDQYFKALDDTGIIDVIKKNYFTVSSFVSDPPQIRNKGTKDQVPFWIIEVPITIWYAAGQQRISENRTLTMTVITVDPSPQNSKGIAIDSIVSSQRVNK